MKVLKFLTKLLILLIIITIIFFTSMYIYSNLRSKLNITTNATYKIYDIDNKPLFDGSMNDKISLKDLSKHTINACISIEDKNFYKHFGFDFLRIGKAFINNIEKKKIVEGASTITQQLAKNLYLDFDKTWDRKIKEAFLTLIIEYQYDKNDILEAYLNTINYGNGNYGIENASLYYFGKSASKLTLEESTILAGIPKNPSKYNPKNNLDESIKRAKIVAKRMYEEKYINKNEYENLNYNNINITSFEKEDNLDTIKYYENVVINELIKLGIDKEKLNKSSLKIYTTFDRMNQKILEENIRNEFRHASELQTASVIINPSNGEITAIVGGVNYNESQFNRAIYSKRQVGSTMKAFLYYGALENNMTSASKFKSEPTTFNLGNGKKYSPSNYGNIFANKEISMAAAIAYSDNIYAVKTNLFLGPEVLVKNAKKCGINESLDANPSLALGTSEINLIDYAQGYSTLASGGIYNKLHTIRYIKNEKGEIIYNYKNHPKVVLNENYVYILNEMLSNTTNSKFKDYASATALSISNKLDSKYAIKTGTTDTDYWIVGYDKNKLMIVWSGYDDNRKFTKNNGYIGKNVFANTMNLINTNPKWYEMPDDVVGKLLDATTGNNTNDKSKLTMYYFLKGSEN